MSALKTAPFKVQSLTRVDVMANFSYTEEVSLIAQQSVLSQWMIMIVTFKLAFNNKNKYLQPTSYPVIKASVVNIFKRAENVFIRYYPYMFERLSLYCEVLGLIKEKSKLFFSFNHDINGRKSGQSHLL